MTLGRYPAMKLSTAHKAHGDAEASLDQGIDPGSIVVTDNHEHRRSPNVKALCSDYLVKYAKAHKKSWNKDEELLNRNIIPSIGTIKAKAVKRRDIRTILDTIIDRGSPIAANRTLAVARKMFNWALEHDIVNSNPCTGIKAPGKEKQRDRVLSNEEIQSLWKSLSATQLNDDHNDKSQIIHISPEIRVALKLQLTTGQRINEVIGITWNEIQEEEGEETWWTIPKERTKNGIAHRVYLSDLSIDLLQQAQEINAQRIKKSKHIRQPSDFVFPSPLNNSKPISPVSVSRAVTNNRQAFKIAAWNTHDLRRTCGTEITKLGFNRLIMDKVLNHKDQDIGGIYDRHSYNHEKKDALTAWSTKLLDITSQQATNVYSKSKTSQKR